MVVHTEVIKKIVSLAYIFSAVKEKMNGSRHKMHITVYADMFITQSPEYHLFAKFNCHFMIIAPKRKSWSLFKIQYYYLIIKIKYVDIVTHPDVEQYTVCVSNEFILCLYFGH